VAELFDRRGDEICIAVSTEGDTWVKFEPWIQSKIVVKWRGKHVILTDLLQSLQLLFNTENTQEVGHHFH
jgi:hypothetical protein